MKPNSSSSESYRMKVSEFLKNLPPPISYIGVLLEFLGLKNFIFFLSGFVLMNVFIYFEYIPWAKLIKYQPRSQINKEEIIGKQFEWQWAGENWFGYIQFGGEDSSGAILINRARMYILRREGDNFILDRRAFKESDARPGRAIISDDRKSVEIEIQIIKDGQIEFLSGSLVKRTSFANLVEYGSDKRHMQPFGDMILVDYKSHVNPRNKLNAED